MVISDEMQLKQEMNNVSLAFYYTLLSCKQSTLEHLPSSSSFLSRLKELIVFSIGFYSQSLAYLSPSEMQSILFDLIVENEN